MAIPKESDIRKEKRHQLSSTWLLFKYERQRYDYTTTKMSGDNSCVENHVAVSIKRINRVVSS
jgi:hypothetical protein